MSTPSRVRQVVTADEGAAIVEYAIMLAFIAVALFAATAALGQTISTFFTDVGAMLAGMLP